MNVIKLLLYQCTLLWIINSGQCQESEDVVGYCRCTRYDECGVDKSFVGMVNKRLCPGNEKIICCIKVEKTTEPPPTTVNPILKCGTPQLSSANPYRWMVLLEYNVNNKQNILCGGSLIHPKVVLTAAHCFDNKDKTKIKVYAGSNNNYPENISSFQERKIDEVIFHNGYSGDFQNDVALIFLNNQFELSDNIGTVCLQLENMDDIDESKCILTGWGRITPDNTKYPRTLKVMNLSLVNNDECIRTFSINAKSVSSKLHASFVCAAGNMINFCRRDEGSPLVCPSKADSNLYLQVGIASLRDSSCGKRNIPSIYTIISEIQPWIDGEMQARQLNFTTYKES